MDPSLFARLAEGLTPYNPWSVNAFADHDLDGWISFSDQEIELIRAQLAERFPSTTPQEVEPVPPTKPEEEEEEDDQFPDDDPSADEADPRLLPPVRDFNLDSLNPGQYELFTAILQSPEWQLASTFRDQISMAVKSLHFGPVPASFGQLGKLFNTNKGTVYKMYEKSLTTTKPRGRPPALNPSQQEAMERFIMARWTDGVPPTFDAISNFLDQDLRVVLPIDTVRHLIYKLPGMKVVVGKPMEKERVEVNPEEIIEFYDRLRPVMTGLPADLVFNLDEAGYQEWADRTDIKVIVPDNFEGDVVEVPYNRADNRSTMLVCISASGTSLPPLIIVQRKTTEQELYDIGYTPDKVGLTHQESGFINTELFNSWVVDVLLPRVDIRRAELSYQGWAVLLLDGCSCHCSEQTSEQCASHGVIVIMLPPHSSDQTQALDVGMFAIHKAVMRRVFAPNWLSNQSKQIYRMLGAWQAVSTPPNIISAFKQVGIHVEWSDDHKTLLTRVDPSTARRLREPRTPEEAARHRIRLNIQL
jgi:hypothetical protein